MSDVLTELSPTGVWLITLNRPDKLNNLGGTLLEEFAAAMHEATHDPAIRVVAVTGAGRGFCAGADLASGRRREPGADEPGHLARSAGVRKFHETFAAAMYRCPKPTVALVNGPAAGAGMGMSLSADFRIAARSAFFTSAFARIGLAGDSGITYGLSRLVGRAKALEILMLSERIPAERALAMGLVRQVVDDDQLMAVGMEFCDQLAAGPITIFSIMKRNLEVIERSTHQDGLLRETVGIAISGSTGDSAAAMQAFMQKRAPVFH
jgi:2-(1,2-epoxy-1,2-dihydrophenyl)acetyl-CoA isomerase